jgi:hypothetical protein
MDGLEAVTAACSISTLVDVSTIRFVLLLVFGAALFGFISEVDSVIRHRPNVPPEVPPELPGSHNRHA